MRARRAEGDASLRLVEARQQDDADPMVLGEHGQSAAEELRPSSVTPPVLAEAGSDVRVSAAPHPAAA